MIDGIDVSNNNGAVDWPAVAAAGKQFALIKCSEGTYFRDAYAPANWQGAEAAGLCRTAYHFARPDRSAAADEADYFLTYLAELGGLLPGDSVMLDLEMSPAAAALLPATLAAVDEVQPHIRRLPRTIGPQTLLERMSAAGAVNLLPWALAWLSAVEQRVQCKPLFYSGAWFMQPHGLTGDATLAQYGLNLAAYQDTLPDPPPAWSFLAMWQYSGAGVCPGVSGPCDLDRFNGSLVQLRLYGAPARPQATNDDLVEIMRLVLGADYAAARDYVGRFA